MQRTAPVRVVGLDLLRGACAVLVLLYHVTLWKGLGEHHTWGLFGVYIFFALSGASLTIAYRDKFDAGYPLTAFILLRFARLMPLFLLVSIVMLAHKVHAEGPTSQAWWEGLLSTSLLFGLGNPGVNSMVLGGWSLGIEFVFYLAFPVLMAFAFSRSRWILGAVLFALQVAFIELTLTRTPDFRSAWASYIQPQAFVAYFFAGCLIGRFVLLGGSMPLWLRFALIAVCAPAIVSLSGETATATLTGPRGVVLALMSIALVFAASQFRPTGPWTHKVCNWFGDISYGTYLLHPLAFIAVSKLLPNASAAVTVAIVLFIATFSAWGLEHYFERPLRNRARTLIEPARVRPTS
jgi:peptidoglycan/LPS O-acetylase OafA/YrhL